MKKYLFFAIALLATASCAKEEVAESNKPIHNGEIEESYLAINLSASDITRAQTGFEDGTAEERAVSHADFFFFDEAGNAFNVTGNPATTPGGGTNHLRATNVEFSADDDNGDDISDTSTPVLLLKTYKGQFPSKIVAVLNWSPDTDKYSLTELHEAVSITGEFNSKDYFVMSNAVYAQGTTEVYATPLTMENIKSTEDDALKAPISIYVERVAAKVQVNTNDKYEVKAGEVYAKILNWDLYRDNPKSKLLKKINGSWDVNSIGFNWNDEPWYRSYWAESLLAPADDEIFGDSPYLPNAHTYIGENTTGKNSCTKAVIKAQLVNSADKPLEIAIWNNVEYVDVESSTPGESLRTAVANTLKNIYFAKTTDGVTTTYTGLTPEDLKCVAGGTAEAPNGVAANEVYFQLSDAGAAKDWWKLVNGVYETVAADISDDPKSVKATNEALKSVPAAVLYENGETFYYVDIKHLGKPNSDAEYGIVRNHVYNITINSIGGYGSPVYEGTKFVDYPQITEQNTYVSAEINILSWKLVNQGVDIQPKN